MTAEFSKMFYIIFKKTTKRGKSIRIYLTRDARLIRGPVAGSSVLCRTQDLLDTSRLWTTQPVPTVLNLSTWNKFAVPKLLLCASGAHNRRVPNGVRFSRLNNIISSYCYRMARCSVRQAIAPHRGRPDFLNWRLCFRTARYYIDTQSPRPSTVLCGDRSTPVCCTR
jgi:hypothetical protein